MCYHVIQYQIEEALALIHHHTHTHTHTHTCWSRTHIAIMNIAVERFGFWNQGQDKLNTYHKELDAKCGKSKLVCHHSLEILEDAETNIFTWESNVSALLLCLSIHLSHSHFPCSFLFILTLSMLRRMSVLSLMAE